ncbi:MAG: hypothetical protein RBS39_11010 [Phycisphaerales bacterium]|nr:hypothetical protein [Phycisphaerales bacterium]
MTNNPEHDDQQTPDGTHAQAPSSEFSLAGADARAVDRFFGESGGDFADHERDARLASLLALLDPGVSIDAALVDVTMVRVARTSAAEEYELSPIDIEAIDALAMAGCEAGRVPHALRDRATRAQALGGLLTSGDAFDPALREERIERLMVRIESAERDAIPIEAYAGRGQGRGSFRLSDLISAAAAVLLLSAIVWPVASTWRQRARLSGCENAMMQTASAMGVYAGDYRDALPIATAGFGGTWWDVGSSPERSNSANLFTLARERYAPMGALACPGNEMAPTGEAREGQTDWGSIDDVSYSYQIMFGPVKPVWKDPSRAVILADHSPVVLKAVRGEAIEPLANSPNHGGTGQYVLFADGSSRWQTTPLMEDGDNIWLPRQVERQLDAALAQVGIRIIKGTETPETADDSFLGP